jgi:hypothetical protein
MLKPGLMDEQSRTASWFAMYSAAAETELLAAILSHVSPLCVVYVVPAHGAGVGVGDAVGAEPGRVGIEVGPEPPHLE